MAKPTDNLLDAPSAPVPTGPKSSGNWKTDKEAGYVCNFFPPVFSAEDPTVIVRDAYFEGPDDAFVWFGQPYEGFPYTNEQADPLNEHQMIKVPTFLDPAKISVELAGVTVEWVAWDQSTQCNVYKRVSA